MITADWLRGIRSRSFRSQQRTLRRQRKQRQQSIELLEERAAPGEFFNLGGVLLAGLKASPALASISDELQKHHAEVMRQAGTEEPRPNFSEAPRRQSFLPDAEPRQQSPSANLEKGDSGGGYLPLQYVSGTSETSDPILFGTRLVFNA